MFREGELQILVALLDEDGPAELKRGGDFVLVHGPKWDQWCLGLFWSRRDNPGHVQRIEGLGQAVLVPVEHIDVGLGMDLNQLLGMQPLNDQEVLERCRRERRVRPCNGP